MSVFDGEERFTVSLVSDDSCFKRAISGKSGLCVIHDVDEDTGKKIAKSNSGDFVKWIAKNRKEVSVSYCKADITEVLHSAEIWLPLIYLANDVSLQVFLGMVSNYLYDKSRGLLIGEKSIVHLKVEYIDEMSGKTKRLEYDGDSEGLKVLMKGFKKM